MGQKNVDDMEMIFYSVLPVNVPEMLCQYNRYSRRSGKVGKDHR
jgi:hypothetical protein